MVPLLFAVEECCNWAIIVWWRRMHLSHEAFLPTRSSPVTRLEWSSNSIR